MSVKSCQYREIKAKKISRDGMAIDRVVFYSAFRIFDAPEIIDIYYSQADKSVPDDVAVTTSRLD